MKSVADAICVDPARVDEVWPHVLPYIEAALRRGGDDTPEIILADLRTGRGLLWIVWDGAAIIAAATTTLFKTSRGLICSLTTCGGRDLSRWRNSMDAIERYARAEGCTALRFQGRRGWRRIFPEFREPWITLEKRIA